MAPHCRVPHGRTPRYAAQDVASLALFAFESSGFCWNLSLWER